MNKRKKLLIVYDYFYPGFRAGGPIQSLTNLVLMLLEDYEVYVLTGAYDLKETTAYTNITVNTWNKISFPAREETVNVFYKGSRRFTKNAIKGLLDNISPDIIYLNGIFSYNFFLLPLLTVRSRSSNYRIIICPRGMLKKGALSSKSFKKNIYLAGLRFSGLLNRVCWHATSKEEVENIKDKFKVRKSIVVAPNIPKAPVENISYKSKQADQLSLVYLSLINEHKNLLLLLTIIEPLQNVKLDIYGPVVDANYWQQCETLIKRMPGKVEYKGEVQPSEVQLLLSQYHALILLTKGENFGHAIYESLSVGRPVLISNYTPWSNLQEKKAGSNMDIGDRNDCSLHIQKMAEMGQEEYNLYCKASSSLATNYYNNLNALALYKNLFS